eukprot:scaffold2741_cov134-Isochrysis_galbana.AAC.11
MEGIPRFLCYVYLMLLWGRGRARVTTGAPAWRRVRLPSANASRQVHAQRHPTVGSRVLNCSGSGWR